MALSMGLTPLPSSAALGCGSHQGYTKGEGTTRMLTAAAVILETLGVRMQSQRAHNAWEHSPAVLFPPQCPGDMWQVSEHHQLPSLHPPAPWIWLNCIPLLHCPTPKGQNVLLAAPGFLPGQGEQEALEQQTQCLFQDPIRAMRLKQLSSGCPAALRISLSVCMYCSASFPTSRVDGCLSAQNQKVLNGINNRHRKLG